MSGVPRLGGKRTLITGGGSGIGLATAIRFKSEGAQVALLDRDEDSLARAKETLGDVVLLHVDVTDEAQVEQAFDSVMERWGGLDVLVANAAVQLFGQDAAVHELDRDVWDQTIGVNLTGTFLTCKYGVRCLLSSGGGSVICTASPTSQFGVGAGFDAYSASKGGVLALARVMANDYAANDIRVNAVVPGVTATPLIEGLIEDAEAMASLVAAVPMGRVGTAEDVTGVMVYLASDDSLYATGGVFTVDGGLTSV